MHTEDLKRKQVGPGIPTHPPDPAAKGEEAKVVADEQVVRGNDYNSPPPQGATKSTGTAIDDGVGGAGLGVPPDAQGGAAAERDRDTRVPDERGPAGAPSDPARRH